MSENFTHYPIAIFNLDNKDYSIQTDKYRYNILVLNPEDKINLPKNTKIWIGIIVSDFKEKRQIEKALNIISILKQNNIKHLVFAKNEAPTKIKEISYIAENISDEKLTLFLKFMDLLVFKPCLVGIDYNDVVNLFSKNNGKLEYCKFQNIDLEQLNRYLPNHKNKKLFLVVEVGIDKSFFEAENIITNIINFLKPKHTIFQICLNKKINLYILHMND